MAGPLVGCLITTATAAEPPAERKPYVNVPDTVSPQAQEYLRSLPSPASRPRCPALDDLEGWKKFQQEAEATREPAVKAALEQYTPTVSEATLGGVPVLDVRPKNWTDNDRVLIYVHGGAYVRFSARTGLPSAVVAADATGLRVISIDYTLAPFSKWQQTTDQVVAAIEALKKQGIPLARMAIYGDSAGGGLAAGAVLKMRDQGLGMPAGVVLWSPWADITNSGDTAVTLMSICFIRSFHALNVHQILGTARLLFHFDKLFATHSSDGTPLSGDLMP
jgi:acetyl esterase/lipase